MNRRPLSPTEVVTRLSTLGNGWTLSGSDAETAIEKSFKFPGFHETMAFVNAVAFVANRMDHHPEMVVHYGSCTVRWRTHQPPGLSELDFEAATRVDALLA